MPTTPVISQRGRGCPRKNRQKPVYSDFPVNWTLEEQECWFKAKMMERWRYNKLSSTDEEQYRQRKNTRTTKYYYDKKNKANPNGSNSSYSAGHNTGRDDLEGIKVFDDVSDKLARSQEQSRIR